VKHWLGKDKTLADDEEEGSALSRRQTAVPSEGLPSNLDSLQSVFDGYEDPPTPARAQYELRRLLAKHPHARKVAPHLAYVLRTLKQDDSFATLRASPGAVAKQALSQLELLTRSRSPGLMLLRNELKNRAEVPDMPLPNPSSPLGERPSVLLLLEDEELNAMHVTESNFDEFFAEQQNWENTHPDPLMAERSTSTVQDAAITHAATIPSNHLMIEIPIALQKPKDGF
jgi:hypothetical protein